MRMLAASGVPMPGIETPPSDGDGPPRDLVAPDGVKLLLERFPHVQMASLQLLVKNEAFRDLCEEYASCTATAERLERSTADSPLRREYNALRLRLEGELLGYLQQHGRGDVTR
jgi:hypothetical protein